MKQRDASKKKEPHQSQKLFIPKGIISPEDDTIVEIPAEYQDTSYVVAKKIDAENSASFPRLNKELANESCRSLKCVYLDESIVNVSVPASQKPSRCAIQSNADLVPYTSRQLPQQNLDLDATENLEKEVILRQLEEFQRARRKFLDEASMVVNTSSSASMTTSRSDFKEKSIRFHDSPTKHTQTYSSDSAFQTARDSMSIHKHLSSGPRQKKKATILDDKESACSIGCKNSGSSDPPVDLNKRIQSEDIEDIDDDDDYVDAFNPADNSTMNLGKKEPNCNECCSKPSKDGGGSRDRRRRGDKSSKSQGKPKEMDKPSSRRSKAIEDVPSKESCLAADCDFGTKKDDASCTPCCHAKSSTTIRSIRSKPLLTDDDFMKIKDQLRQARKRLDEAVALVKNVASTSSTCGSGRASPAISYTTASAPSPTEKASTRMATTAPKHDPKSCPLRGMTDLSVPYRRTKSSTDNWLCLDACLNVEQPVCVANKSPTRQSEEAYYSPRSGTASPKSSSMSCKPMFPCDVPSVTSKQDLTRPVSATTARSLPTSSTKVEDGRRRSSINFIMVKDAEYYREKKKQKEEEDRRKQQSDVVRGPTANQCKNDTNPLCSTTCLNMDPPPCTSKDIFQKKAGDLQKSLRKITVTPDTFPANPIATSTSPKSVRRRESDQDSLKNPTSSAESENVSSSSNLPRLPLCEPRIKAGGSRAEEEEYYYPRTKEKIHRTQKEERCKANQTILSQYADSHLKEPKHAQSENQNQAKQQSYRIRPNDPLYSEILSSGPSSSVPNPPMPVPIKARSFPTSLDVPSKPTTRPESYTTPYSEEYAKIWGQKSQSEGTKSNFKEEEKPRVVEVKGLMKSLSKTDDKAKEDNDTKIRINTTTQTVETTVISLKPDAERLMEYLNNVLKNPSGVNETISKTNTVTFKENKE